VREEKSNGLFPKRIKEKTEMSRTAIVTGASRGIGRAVAKRLAKDGFDVVVNYASNAKEAEIVVTEIQSSGGRAMAIRADVGNATDVENLFADALRAFGRVDIVVNNSGIMPLSPISKADAGTFDKVIQTNLRGAFLVMAQAVHRVQSRCRRTGSCARQ
jgi:3-oxoacyl-[acyl-carrier protein] reductase